MWTRKGDCRTPYSPLAWTLKIHQPFGRPTAEQSATASACKCLPVLNTNPSKPSFTQQQLFKGKGQNTWKCQLRASCKCWLSDEDGQFWDCKQNLLWAPPCQYFWLFCFFNLTTTCKEYMLQASSKYSILSCFTNNPIEYLFSSFADKETEMLYPAQLEFEIRSSEIISPICHQIKEPSEQRVVVVPKC